ncbi:helix-turn-helix domain-containing protein [Leptospira adleri]|uniref:AlbA family DNA-binding domain-containing protein n=1 Tax=Leptospira adleri TaxID=2023186 RepID=UPI000F64685A|nr:ATP-binding protein [Leptospira adleri]
MNQISFKDMKIISEDELNQLLQEGESSCLDFKEKHHENAVALVHDILCLANSPSERDRFIIYGIADNKEIIGVNSEFRRKQSDIADILRSSNLNRIPDFLLYAFKYKGVELDILHIENSSEKPYFLLKDKSKGSEIIRAGVLYSRFNDSNTPKNGTITELEMSQLWMQRFGILKDPLNRALKYLKNPSGWKGSSEDEFYFKPFPEFRLIWESRDPSERFREKWVDKNNPCDLAVMEIKLFYQNTMLRKFEAINLDFRAFFPVPKYSRNNRKHEAFIIKDSLDIYICAIITNSESLYANEDSSSKKDDDIIIDYLKSLDLDFKIYALDISLREE